MQETHIPDVATVEKLTGSTQRRLFEEETESEKSKQNQLEEGKGTIRDDVSFVEKEPVQEENKTSLGDKVPGKQTGDENEVGGSAEERKKRKHGNSASKLTPESKKVHVNENPQLLKELKKIEKEASKKDLTEVKKKVLKSRLDDLINNKENVKRMKDEDRGAFEQLESQIRSLVERDK